MADRILKILFISTFAVMLGLGIISPLMPIYAQNMGATGIWLGLIFSGFSFSRFIFMPIVGKLSDHSGRKKYIVIGLFFSAVISILYTLAQSVYELVGVRVLHGVFSAMVLPIAMAYVGETSEDGSEGKSMGTYNISLFLGMASGPLLGGLINESFGINAVFYVMAALCTLSFFINLFFLPDVRQAVHHSDRKKIRFGKILSNRVVKALFIYRSLNALARGGLMAFLPIVAAQLNLNSIHIGLLVSVNVLLTAVLQRRFGILADRLNKYMMMITGSIAVSLALGLIPLCKEFYTLMILGAVIGLASAWSMPAATALNVKIGKQIGSMGATVGIFNTAQSIGMITAPLLSGLIMDMFGLKFIFFVSSGISIFGTILFYFLLKNIYGKRKNE
ncbi:MAG: MFS transporter [Candidatus Neomarinimicrobiota bacterium]|nr:MAG: MFS transporter [Candidatus Neomarinimicrobiota bacterium]